MHNELARVVDILPGLVWSALPDGRVEAVFEGERAAVERLVEFAREGPRGARVDWVDVVSEEPEGLEGFSVR